MTSERGFCCRRQTLHREVVRIKIGGGASRVVRGREECSAHSSDKFVLRDMKVELGETLKRPHARMWENVKAGTGIFQGKPEIYEAPNYWRDRRTSFSILESSSYSKQVVKEREHPKQRERATSEAHIIMSPSLTH